MYNNVSFGQSPAQNHQVETQQVEAQAETAEAVVETAAPSLDELIAQQKEIAARIEKIKREQKSEAIKQVTLLIAQYDLTKEDIFGRGTGARPASTGKVAPKYRNPATGATWTGRGQPPTWIAGQDRDQFLIQA